MTEITASLDEPEIIEETDIVSNKQPFSSDIPVSLSSVTSEIYLNYFKGREDYFACQGKENYHPIPEQFTKDYLLKHLEQLATFGIYVLTKDSKCHFVCIDIDIPKQELNKVDFRNFRQKFSYLKTKILEILELLEKEFQINKNEVLLEDTGGRGFHIWVFFDEPISGKIAVSIFLILKIFLKFDFEFFPKQEELNEKTKLGNLIKLPLGVHQKYESKSFFFEMIEEKVHLYIDNKESLSYLSTVKKIHPEKLQKILDKYATEIHSIKNHEMAYEKSSQQERNLYKKDLDFLFSHCNALNELKRKAESGIELSYREAFHFSNLMLSIQDSEDITIETLKKSYGHKFRIDTTKKEIDCIRPLYPSSCLKLISQGICRGYCNNEIRTRNEDTLLTKTNPVAFWLIKIEKDEKIKKQDILPRVADPQNIINAYWKLKRYHMDEDVGAYDEFDFNHFEKNLEINSKYVSTTLQTKNNIPFIGYLKINLPKKVDEDFKMQFRQMTYSTIYDQIVIQSVFNVVAKILEQNFLDCSYGYRCTFDHPSSDEIFCDWREYYPKFRSRVLNNLRQQQIKYYICCDIKGFYDDVRHDLLIEQIRGVIDHPYIVKMIEDIIHMYHFEDGNETGLPQGPAYARILANLYLNNFDKEIQNHSDAFVRYVDDFFLFYDSKEKAEKGLRKVSELLSELGLTLSDDEKKKPEILESTNETKIIEKLDSIQYGIFEEFKFIDHLDLQQIINFYDAIEKHHIIPRREINDILDINNKLPSLLYLISKSKWRYHSISLKVPAIIDYLVTNDLFYPKRLKFIFPVIIDLMHRNNYDLPQFYAKLDKAHKVHFLLSLNRKFEKEGKYKKELIDILRQSIHDEDAFVSGFAIGINSRLNETDKYDVSCPEYLIRILNTPSCFAKLILYDSINYLELSPEQKEIIREHLRNDSSFIEKKYLLSTMKSIGIDLVDSVFIGNILASNSFFLVIECCNILASLNDNNSLFRVLENHISQITNHKSLIIYQLSSLIYERYKNSSTTILNNAVELYKEIGDEEIRREILNVINRIKNTSEHSEDEFIKNHKLIKKYNQCCLYQNYDPENGAHNFVEIIPALKLAAYDYQDMDNLRNKCMDLSFGRIMPKLDFQFDSTKKEIVLKYEIEHECKELSNYDFKLKNDVILFSLQLMDDLYKKSRYFFKRFGKVPLISRDNLLLNPTRKEIQFKSFGYVLCPSYFIDNRNLSTNDELIIPIMISSLLKELFFSNDQEKIRQFQNKPLASMELILSHFIGRLRSKKTYSYSRFSYIIQKIAKVNLESDFELSCAYFSERLKSLLFDKNETVNWFSICGALHDLYSEFAKTYDKIDFSKLNYTNKIFFNFDLPRKLHYLSQLILNLTLNYKTIIAGQKIPTGFANMMELLNFYAIFCIEAMSFLKASLMGVSAIHKAPEINVNIAVKKNNYSYSLAERDKDVIQSLIRKDAAGLNVFEGTNIFSITQLSLFYLLRTFENEVKNGVIELRCDNHFSEQKFELLVFNLLVRVPRIEDEIITEISNSLRGLRINLEYQVQGELVLRLKEDILTFCKDMKKIRNMMKQKRNYGSILTREWPQYLLCKSFISRKYKASINTLDKLPLTNRVPTISKSKSSWDISDDIVRNLVIPSERFNKLISRLKKGKMFGRKITFLYSERAKLIWDCFLILIFFGIAVFLYNKNTSSAVFEVVKAISIAGIIALIVKSLKDSKYWSQNLKTAIDYLRE